MYADSYLAECNDAMARMYGVESADQIVGAPLADLLPRSDPANIAYLSAFIASGLPPHGRRVAREWPATARAATS